MVSEYSFFSVYNTFYNFKMFQKKRNFSENITLTHHVCDSYIKYKNPYTGKILPLMRCFIANKELKATKGAIEITYARPAKEDEPAAKSDFCRLLLGENFTFKGEMVVFYRIV